MDNIVRGCNWYFDALNAWRVLDQVEIPDIEQNLEAFTPGGHNMSVEWPEDWKPLAATIKLRNDDPRVRSLCGREPGNYITATYYENLRSFRDGTNKGRVIVLKGLLTMVKAEARKGVKMSGTEYRFSTIVRYEDMVDGAVVHRFDQFVGPGATVVGGQAVFAAMATNLAISGGSAL
jgi:phage tail tube protein FII